MLGAVRGMNGDEAEMKALRLEIAGLETMEANLGASLGMLTAWGKVLAVPHFVFSLYCLYRILATLMATLRRAYYPAASFSSSDPINRFLGLLARHWDPKLDQIAWARQISFLLSGVILAASANSVLQTFRLFSKWMPGLLYQAQANLALVIGQVAAVYVISAALLLRSNLPREMGSAVGDALEGALEPRFVDWWFEGWFLGSCAVTGVGVWISRKIGREEWDDFGSEEMGAKRM
uniref:G-protein coupled n=1 Tax=Colletotrichum fructicola (strain Nara gc5) TaxID=1213859 RepID=L2GEU2_COLFN